MAPWDDESFDPFLVHYGILIEIPDKSGTTKTAWQWD
jgi:hypothetical protein